MLLTEGRHEIFRLVEKPGSITIRVRAIRDCPTELDPVEHVVQTVAPSLKQLCSEITATDRAVEVMGDAFNDIDVLKAKLWATEKNCLSYVSRKLLEIRKIPRQATRAMVFLMR